MIHTSRQIKALVQNQSKGNSAKAQTLIRSYFMERFLERVALSEYKDSFILKGGMLISSIVGLDARSTMDIDGTIKNMPLTVESAKAMIESIVAIPLEDNTTFTIKRVEEIMDEAEYGGIRVALDAQVDIMKTPLKIDISTGDIITPREVSHEYKLMFEDRSISVWAYNLETLLAEKLETVIRRGALNTRLRDFYDIFVLTDGTAYPIDLDTFRRAFEATMAKRGTTYLLEDGGLILAEVQDSDVMQALWRGYQKKFDHAQGITWGSIMSSVRTLLADAVG